MISKIKEGRNNNVYLYTEKNRKFIIKNLKIILALNMIDILQKKFS